MRERFSLTRANLERLLAVLLVVGTIVAYSALPHCNFVLFDDPYYVTENADVRAGLSKAGFTWAFTTFHSANWHPLTWLSHMADSDLYGLNPAGHHLTNLLFHLGNTLLLFLFLCRTTGQSGCSFIVAGLFSLHPLHVESVAWISERKDVLSTFCMLSALLAYAHYVRRPGIRRYLPVLVLFALGLMAKPMLVTFPFLLLLLDYWPFERICALPGLHPFNMEERSGDWGRLVLEKMPLILLTFFSCAATFMAQSAAKAVASLETISLGARLTNAIISYATYLVYMFWPKDLSIFYPHTGNSVPFWPALFSAAFLAGLTTIVVQQASRRPYLFVGWFWYIGTLVPVIGLVQVGNQAMADRYTYIPSIGIFVTLVWGLAPIFQRHGIRPMFTVSFVSTLFLALLIQTRSQVRLWQDTPTLFKHALKVTEDNYLAHQILSEHAKANGDPDTALLHREKALEINPGFVAKMHNRTGYLLAQQGRLDAAVREFEEAVRLYPDYASAHNNLGVILARQGRYEEALVELAEALRISPGDASVPTSIANVERERAGIPVMGPGDAALKTEALGSTR